MSPHAGTVDVHHHGPLFTALGAAIILQIVVFSIGPKPRLRLVPRLLLIDMVRRPERGLAIVVRLMVVTVLEILDFDADQRQFDREDWKAPAGSSNESAGPTLPWCRPDLMCRPRS